MHFPRATHATAISVSTAFQNATGRGRPCAVPTSPWGRGSKEVQGCRLPAFKTRQNYPNPPLQLPGATQAAADLSCSSNKSLRPWQCPFKEVQGCRLPAFKTPQTLPCSSQAPLRPRQTFPAALTSPWGRGSVFLWTRLPFASPQNSPNPSLQLPGATQAAADLSCSSNKSLRPWQRLFMDVQGCRLPALKTPQTLPCSSQAPLRPRQTFPAAPTSSWGRGSVLLRRFKAAVCQPSKLPKSQAPLRPRQTFPAAPTSSWGRGSVLLRRSQAAVCQPSKLAKTPQTLPCSSQAPLRPPQTFPAAPTSPWGRGSVLLRRFKAAVCQPSKLSNPPLQLPGATQAAADLSCSSNKFLRPWQRLFMDVQGCRLPALKTPQTLPCSSQAPLRPRQTFPAALTSPWGRGSVFLWTRLPFASPQNSPNPSLQLPGATQAAADLSCSSNKSLRPWQCPFKEVQGCRLPAFKTPQTLPCSSQAPLRPRQTFPAAPTSSWGCGSVLLRRSQAAVCQPSKLAKTPQTLPCSSQAPLRPPQTFPAAPTSPWGRGSVLLRRLLFLFCFRCLFLGNVPLLVVTWFSRWHVMLDSSAATWQRWPNNSGADRATVRMTPCLLADFTVLDVKLIVAHRSMVDLPCLHVAVHKSIAKWALVNKTFLCDNAVPYRKFVPTDTPMVDFPCLHIAVHKALAKWTCVNNRFLCHNTVFHSESLPAGSPMIYFPCAYSADHWLRASRTDIFETLSPLRCLSFLCRQSLLLAGLAAFLPFTCLQGSLLFFGVSCLVFALFFFWFSFLCSGLLHFSSPFLFCAGILGIRTGHFCPFVFSPLFCLRLCLVRSRALLFSIPFSFRNGSPDIGDGACLCFFRCPPRDFRLRCRYPLYCFADASPGNGALPAVATDLVTITRTMLCQPGFKSARCLLYLADAASPPAPCFTRTI